MSTETRKKLVQILLVEDNPGDVRLTREALRDDHTNHLTWTPDGVEALACLHREGKYADAPRPDLILLDLSLPRKDGREVLAEIKQDPELRRIPVVVITSSERSEEHTSELQSLAYLVCRLLLEKKKKKKNTYNISLLDDRVYKLN